MPKGVFKPYAGVATAILIFTNTNAPSTDSVWFYNMTADGFSLDNKRTPVQENDIPDIIQRFHHLSAEATRTRSEQSFMVPQSEIKAQGYSLSFNTYSTLPQQNEPLPQLSELLQSICHLQQSIDANLAQLADLMAKDEAKG